MDGQIQRLDVPHLNPAQCLTQPYAVAGVTEHEEGNQYESREKHGDNREALLVGHIVADLSDSGGQFPLGPVPHLII